MKKKNQRRICTLLLAVVLLFTMCKPKTDGNIGSRMANKANFDSTNRPEEQAEVIYDFDEKAPGENFQFKLRLYSNVDSLNSNVRLFVKVNNGSEKRLNDFGITSIPVNTTITTNNTVITTLEIYGKEELTPGIWTIIPGTSKIIREEVPAPITIPSTSNVYFTYTNGSWFRNPDPKAPNYVRVYSCFDSSGNNAIIVTWPPTYSK